MGNYEPTTFFILENEELGTWWVGKSKIELDAMDFPTRRSVSQSELLTKLEKKFETHHMYTQPSLDIRFLNNSGIVCYGIERFLSKLDYKIRKNPQMYEELRKLLTAGWTNDDFTMPSTLHVLHIWNPNKLTNINDLYSDLKRNWGVGGEGQLRSFHRLNKCLNERTGKPEDLYLYQKGRAKLLREMKKTGKRPKQSTIEKYKITFEEILDIKKMPEEKLVMEEARGIIYKISSPSGKVYVGQTTKRFEKRIKQHHRKDSGCTAISRAIHKYGDHMKYEIIEEDVPQEQLDEREVHWIKELNSLTPGGYNLNSGGRFFQITQEAKDHLRDTQQRLTIERNGYLGTVQQHGDLFVPVINNNTVYAILSNGSFKTKEEAIEVLKEYTRDPENFTKVEGTVQRSVGCVYRNNTNKWAAAHKRDHLGVYDTQEEAEEVLKKYLEDPEKVPVVKKSYGGVCKDHRRNNTWMARYKGKYLGNYKTREEGEEALERYVKDPENFINLQKKVGCVYKKCNRWVVVCKTKRLGSYETEEEAQKVLKEYVETLQSSL
jgi:group I intron endonuclease